MQPSANHSGRLTGKALVPSRQRPRFYYSRDARRYSSTMAASPGWQVPAQLEVGSAAVLQWVLALAEVSVWASAHVWVLLLRSPVLLVLLLPNHRRRGQRRLWPDRALR